MGGGGGVGVGWGGGGGRYNDFGGSLRIKIVEKLHKNGQFTLNW